MLAKIRQSGKRRSSGFILINYLFYFLCVVIVTTYFISLSTNYTKMLKQTQKSIDEWVEKDTNFFKLSEEACRDTCLINEVLY